MARGGVSEDDLYAFMMSAGGAARAARYRQEAERFRQLAAAETDESVRQSFLGVASEYDQLADALFPPEPEDGRAT